MAAGIFEKFGFSRPKEERDAIRDDNLRLIFAELIAEAQAERMATIRSGFRLLGWLAALVAAGLIALAYQMSRARAYQIANGETPSFGWELVFSPFGIAVLAGALVLTLTLAILVVEHRRTGADIAEHQAFLKRYNRLD